MIRTFMNALLGLKDKFGRAKKHGVEVRIPPKRKQRKKKGR